jgi:ketosteroid isomerase-like protein
MRQTNEIFDTEVFKKKNLDALDRVYTSTARILPPGAPMMQGLDQIKAFWKSAIDSMGATNAKLTTVSAEMAGDGVIEIGSADLSGSSGHLATVKYVVHWKQEDGAWKWHVDIWNTNA